ncbi:MAG: helix-turn-helix transcriptional regulator [Slackia sp.]|nr:helix-turn-helix transcriptional regulator [Slackia sp.]
MSFRDNLQHLRATRNMTQEQLAMLLGVSRQSVTKWEAEKSYPEMDKLLKMCTLFECSLDDLVQGDLTARPMASSVAEGAVPDGPAADVCGYDEHMRDFAMKIPTGIAFIVLGLAWTVFAGEGLTGVFQEGAVIAVAGLFAGIFASLALFIPAGMEHASFVRAHPYIDDFYTAEQKARAGRHCARSIIAGIGIVFAAVVVIMATESQRYAHVGTAIAMALIAAAVWLIVYASMMYTRTNVDAYNSKTSEGLEFENAMTAAVDEERKKALLIARGIKTRRQRIRDNLCGVIMLIATIAGLAMLFAPIAQGVDPDDVNWAANLFWMAWVIGGLCCGIVALLVNAFVKEE